MPVYLSLVLIWLCATLRRVIGVAGCRVVGLLCPGVFVCLCTVPSSRLGSDMLDHYDREFILPCRDTKHVPSLVF
jgi:hypothetical protein